MKVLLGGGAFCLARASPSPLKRDPARLPASLPYPRFHQLTYCFPGIASTSLASLTSLGDWKRWLRQATGLRLANTSLIRFYGVAVLVLDQVPSQVQSTSVTGPVLHTSSKIPKKRACDGCACPLPGSRRRFRLLLSRRLGCAPSRSTPLRSVCFYALSLLNFNHFLLSRLCPLRSTAACASFA